MNSPQSRRVLGRLAATLGASVSALALLTAHPAAAQTTATAGQSQQLQEVVVTAERRTSNVQKTAASIVVVRGTDVLQEGRSTTAEILETVPNLVVGGNAGPGGAANANGDNPNGNITIRGVQTEQGNGGLTTAPATTAVYVDDIYQGIGTDYDLDRVEVLEGPQGTLYGRSATGGVVAFHTADPVIGKLTGNFSLEYGNANTIQTTAAISVPLGDQFAVRVAGREYQQDGYFNGEAGHQHEEEARVKVLWQPDSDTRVIASWSIDEHHNNAGGDAFLLSSPNKFNFLGSAATNGQVYTEESRYHQYSLNANHDFGFGNFTYIGAFHDFDHDVNNPPPEACPCGGYQVNPSTFPLDQFHTEEIRLASDPGSRLTWLVGANFYANLLKTTTTSIQTSTNLPADTPNLAGYANALVFSTAEAGETYDYGLFTEESYAVTPAFKITAGARLDETQLHRTINEVFNANLGAMIFSENPSYPGYNPAEVLNYTKIGSPIYRNFTYKARAEYDLTPQNLVYAMVSSSFLPGDLQIDPTVDPFAATPAGIVTFSNFSFSQERLTAYEVGSKNRFLDNTLELNGDVYYYDYAGYHILANTSLFGPPVFALLSLPVRMIGGELTGVWRFTPDDRVTVLGGVTNTRITSFPADVGGTGNSAALFVDSDRVPDVPEVQLTAFYDHTFSLADGSTIVPRAEVRYQSDSNVVTFSVPQAQKGEEPYTYQGPVTQEDFYTTYTSPNGKYSLTGYVRNIGNVIYKTGAQLNGQGNLNIITGAPGNPRTYGGVFTAKF